MTLESQSSPSPKRHRWLSWVGLLLLAWLIWHLGPDEILSALSRTDLALFACAFLFYFPTILIRIWRWRIILRCNDIEYGFARAAQAYLIGILIGLATPGRIGEFSRAMFLRNDVGVPLVRGLPTVLADRLFDFLVLIPIAGLALISLGPAQAKSGWMAVGVLAGGLGLGLLLILHTPTIKRLRMLLARMAPKSRVGAQISELLDETNRGFRQIRPLAFVHALSATAVAFVFFYAECFIIAKSLGMEVTPIAPAYAISLGILVSMVPLSISGIGTRDAAVIAYLSLYAVPPAMAIGFSLLWFLAFYGMNAFLGTVAWLLRNYAKST
jgi:uncharacterized protein (TIRG00374 family)